MHEIHIFLYCITFIKLKFLLITNMHTITSLKVVLVCDILRNYLNSWGLIFVDCGFLVIPWDFFSWMRRFVVLVRKLNNNLFVFVEYILVGKGCHKYWATAKSKDFKVYFNNTHLNQNVVMNEIQIGIFYKWSITNYLHITVIVLKF